MGGLLSQMRYVGYGLAQTFPPKAQFSPEQMPDLSGKVCLVTGAPVAQLSPRSRTPH